MANSAEFKVLDWKPLTVENVREQFWDKDTGTGKPISYYSPQTFGGVFSMHNGEPMPFSGNPSVFIPDGSLWRTNARTDAKTSIPDWLSSGERGPYLQTTTTPTRKRGSRKPAMSPTLNFFELGGVFQDGEHERGPGFLQICSGPLNVLSEDCLDETNVWIPTHTSAIINSEPNENLTEIDWQDDED